MLDLILRFIPDRVKTQLKDQVVDILTNASSDEKWRKLIRSFRSDAAFLSAFDAALERAVKHFSAEYQDKELVEVLTENTKFWDLPSVQKALKEIVNRPSSYLASEREVLLQSFGDVAPNIEPERVELAARFFLRCLAEEVINIPQLFPLYQIQLQKASLDQAREMINSLKELQIEQRQAMVALLDTVTQNRLLLPDPTQTTVPEKLDVYNNLPRPDYTDFVGRDQEKAKVVNLLSPQRREWVITIDGVGGVGKTALALEVAYYFMDNYSSLPEKERFKAIIWTSAKQTVLTADGIHIRPQVLRTLEDIFTVISITLNCEEILRARAEEQTTLVLEALAKQRTLLIVDNLETIDDDRLLEFLRELPSPTKCIVTTRHQIDVASHIRIVGLSELDALALIGHLSEEKEVKISEDDAQKLYVRTGGLPLAIVWSMSLISYGYSIKSVLTRLGSAKSDVIKFSFQNSVEIIKDQDTYKTLLALSLFAKDATREALGYIAGFGEDEVGRDDSLAVLGKLALVNKQANRFSLLPLTKIFASAELEKDVNLKNQLLNMWRNYFVLGFNTRNSSLQDLDYFELELVNILGFLDWCILNLEIESLITFLVNNTGIFWARGNWAEYTYYLNFAYNTPFVKNTNNEKVAKLLYEFANVNYFTGEMETAEKLFLQALELFENLKNNNYVLRTCRRLAGLYADTGKVSDAYTYIIKANEVFSDSNRSEEDLMKLKRFQARVEIAAEKFDNAVKLLLEVINYFEHEEKHHIGTLILCYSTLGRAEIGRKNYKQAQEALTFALQLARKTSVKPDLAWVLHSFAYLKQAIGENEDAIKYANEALNLYNEFGMRLRVAETRAIIANCKKG